MSTLGINLNSCTAGGENVSVGPPFLNQGVTPGAAALKI